MNFLKRKFSKLKLGSLTPYHLHEESDITPLDDYVPKTTTPMSSETLDKLLNFLHQNKDIPVITGAGLSTESGIPDYRSPNGSYSRGHRPIRYQEFANS